MKKKKITVKPATRTQAGKRPLSAPARPAEKPERKRPYTKQEEKAKPKAKATATTYQRYPKKSKGKPAVKKAMVPVVKKPVTKSKAAKKVGWHSWPSPKLEPEPVKPIRRPHLMLGPPMVVKKSRSRVAAAPVPLEAIASPVVAPTPPAPVVTVQRLAGRHVRVKLTGTDENVLIMMRLVEDAMATAGVPKEVLAEFRNRCNARDVHSCRQARDIAAQYVEIV